MKENPAFSLVRLKNTLQKDLNEHKFKLDLGKQNVLLNKVTFIHAKAKPDKDYLKFLEEAKKRNLNEEARVLE